MDLRDIIRDLSLDVITPELDLHREVTGGYVSDLLSDVMGNSHQGNLWVTFQVHINIIAVASLKGHSGIILVHNRKPEAETLKRAIAENIPIMTTSLPTFELVGRLYALGLR